MKEQTEQSEIPIALFLINVHSEKELLSHREEEESNEIILQASSWFQVDREKQKKQSF